MGTKWQGVLKQFSVVAAAAALAASGCGGGSGSTANQVVVSLTGTASVMVPTQSQTLTATVTGATDVSSDFKCDYTTTPNPTASNPTPKPSASATCESANGAVGTLSNIQNTSTTVSSTATFTAPSVFPDQTKFPNVTVTITATAHANTKKTATFNITFDSGIRVFIVPSTATMATNEARKFNAIDATGSALDPTTLNWGLTYEVTATTSSASCAAASTNSCGSIDANGIYTAPATVPTATTAASGKPPVNAAGVVTLFAISKVDNARIGQATVTIVQGGPISFNGISPTVMAQGAQQQDLFLNAPNSTSQNAITITPPAGSGQAPFTITQDNNVNGVEQFKVVFSASTTSAAIGVKVRLFANNLTVPGDYSVQLSSNNPTETVTGGPFTLHVIPVKPSVTSASPRNFTQAQALQPTALSIDGGYFGQPPIVSAQLIGQGTTTGFLADPSSTAERLIGQPNGGSVAQAGFVPVSVINPKIAAPAPNTSYTNFTVIPDYANTNPPIDPAGSGTPLTLAGPPNPKSVIYNAPAAKLALGANFVPSAIAVDSQRRLAVVTDANPSDTNNVQILSLTGSVPAPGLLVPSGGSLATSVAIDDALVDTSQNPTPAAVVVNYASRSLSLINILTGAQIAPPIDLSQILPANPPNPVPFPYAVGVDPFLHRAVVAFASTNVGLLVNYDPNANPMPACLPNTGTAPYCAIAFVTLNTGANPQVAFEPESHLAFVTPGGQGNIAAVNMSALSGQGIPIKSLTRTAHVVQVTTATAHDLSVAKPGTVLIAGVPQGSKGTNFNGSFPVIQVLDSFNFTYAQDAADDSVTCPAASDPCVVNSGTVSLNFNLSPTVQGIDFNPVTRQAVLADPELTQGQITYLSPQSETLTSTSLFTNITGPNFSGTATELGTSAVAFQPFSNTAVSFNPRTSQLSILDPSANDRAAIVNLPTSGSETSVSFTPSGGSAITVSIPGAVAVDPVMNMALVVASGNSGSPGGILIPVVLGKINSLSISQALTPAIPGTTLERTILITAGSLPTSPVIVRILGAGFTATTTARLDGSAIPTTLVSSTEVDASVPVALLTSPRRFGLDVFDTSNGAVSNVTDLTVLESIPLAQCQVSGTATNAAPGGVAIDDQRGLALVTETGCSQLAAINLNSGASFGSMSFMPTGASPTGVAVLPSLTPTLGVAVVTNNGAGTASILNLDTGTQIVSDITTGAQPTGVAINPETNLAVIVNTGANSVTTVDLTPLTANPVGTLSPNSVAVDQTPIAVAIDPDRGSNGRGLAVVTALQVNSLTGNSGVLDAVDIGASSPVKNASTLTSFLSATPTGIAFNPAVSTGTANPGLFYVVSSQGNVINTFNPDNSATGSIKVGVNPTSIAVNPETATIVTVNSLSNSISLVDAQTSQTVQTIGIGASGPLAVAVSPIRNLAVISDQSNNRVLLLPLP